MMELDELVAGLHAADPDARARCCEHLALLRDEAAPAAVELVRAVGDEHESVREWAVAALESLGEPWIVAVPELSQLARSDSADVAYWAVTLLGRLGPRAGEAVPVLADLLHADQPLEVRQRSALALGEIGAGAGPAGPALAAAADDPDPRLARLAMLALDRIGRR